MKDEDGRERHDCEPATEAEREWLVERLLSYYSRKHVLEAPSDEAAERWMRQHKEYVGGCCRSGAPAGDGYWFNASKGAIEGWFGPRHPANEGGPLEDEKWTPGSRYVRVAFRRIARETREAETSPSLFESV